MRAGVLHARTGLRGRQVQAVPQYMHSPSGRGALLSEGYELLLQQHVHRVLWSEPDVPGGEHEERHVHV